jgi:hypothetical protein
MLKEQTMAERARAEASQ